MNAHPSCTWTLSYLEMEEVSPRPVASLSLFFLNLFGVKKASLTSLKISKTTSLKAKGKKNVAGHWEMFVSGSE